MPYGKAKHKVVELPYEPDFSKSNSHKSTPNTNETKTNGAL